MKKGFNFLKPQVEAPSQWSAIYDWITGTAKAILIVFEVAVILALGIRIVVDVQGKNIDQQIETLETIMSQRSYEEEKYRLLQQKTLGFSTIWTRGQIYSEVYNQINEFLPQSSVKFDVSIIESKINISGKATNINIDTMEKGLKESPLFKDTKLTILEKSSSEANQLSTYSFTSTITNPRFRVLSDPNIVTVTPINQVTTN